MLTNDDLIRIKEIVEMVVEVKLKPIKVEVDKIKYLPTTDQYLSEADKIYGELQAMRETMEIQSGYKDQLEDHEVRIEKLELVVG